MDSEPPSGAEDGDWTFTPTRFIPGTTEDGLIGTFRAVRRLRRATARYLSARGLPRPSIPWNSLDALKRQTALTERATG